MSSISLGVWVGLAEGPPKKKLNSQRSVGNRYVRINIITIKINKMIFFKQ
jgi:hypothetical protein